MENTLKWELKSFDKLVLEPGCCLVRDLGGAEKMQKSNKTTNEKTLTNNNVLVLFTLQNRSH